jgi:DNA-directed RNA polymerase specialized sigma54-like protein
MLEFINERGFCDGDLENISKILHVDFSEVEQVYNELKSVHPYGIGARNLREYLLLRMDHNARNKYVDG